MEAPIDIDLHKIEKEEENLFSIKFLTKYPNEYQDLLINFIKKFQDFHENKSFIDELKDYVI